MAHPYLVRIKWKVRSRAQDSPGVWVGAITQKKGNFKAQYYWTDLAQPTQFYLIK